MLPLVAAVVAALGLAGSLNAQPTNNWRLTLSENACIAEKSIEHGTISIELPAPTPKATITIGTSGSPQAGTVTITGVGAKPITAPLSVGRDAQGRPASQFILDRGDFEAMLAAPAIEIQGVGNEIVKLSPIASEPAIAVMHQCEAQLLTALKLDPSVALKAQTAAVGKTGYWLTNDDFPKGGGGVAVIIWTVGLDLAAHDCRVLASAGNRALGPLVCHLMEQRGRYEKPALDAQGNPTISYATRIVRAAN